ncbi:MAG: Gfo/Idh/MocA family oxidoreductase [Saprospiraceae bacterium]|nr:Gfo/Idh/MocA family oxidoreductase [Saprospiraceae bacterium]
MKRRKLLHGIGILGAGLMANPVFGCKSSTSQSTVEQSKKKLGVALLGLGGYSRGQLAPALQLTEHCELRGIVTGSPDKVPTWQSKYNIPDTNVYSYDSLPDIANNDDIDVVYIVVPTGLHAKYSIMAAEAGKHVWCEKPMAMDVLQCQSIIDACNKNKVRLSIGYRVMHEPNTQQFNSYAQSLPFGPMKSVISQAGYGGSDPGNGWRGQKKMGGGAMYDMGVYTVNGALGATELDAVRVLEASHPRMATEVDLTTAYTLELSNGLIVEGKTSVVEGMNQLRIDCDKGWYAMAPMQSYNGVKGERSDGVKLNQHCPNQQARQMDDDALAIMKETDVIAPGEMGLRDVRIINAIFESARTGSPVDV